MLIKKKRSIIISCDVCLEDFKKILKQTGEMKEIGGYKIGFQLSLVCGLAKIVKIARKYTNKPIIYDHQKAGTDIPSTGKSFMKLCKKAGIDAVIIFPLSGPQTEKAWILAAKSEGLRVIVGGFMTHPSFKKTENGFISDAAIPKIYLLAAQLGVRNFVAPGNRPRDFKKIKILLENKGISPIFYAPGFIAQGGEISQIIKIAPSRLHLIIGRGIYRDNIPKAIKNYYRQIQF